MIYDERAPLYKIEVRDTSGNLRSVRDVRYNVHGDIPRYMILPNGGTAVLTAEHTAMATRKRVAFAAFVLLAQGRFNCLKKLISFAIRGVANDGYIEGSFSPITMHNGDTAHYTVTDAIRTYNVSPGDTISLT